MLHKIDSYTIDNQFDFKQNHGTIDYYKRNSSPVFICYLDASKAFDRVNHWCLFKKLINRYIPITIIRLFVRWYGSQLYRVRWGNLLSDGFTSTKARRTYSRLYLFTTRLNCREPIESRPCSVHCPDYSTYTLTTRSRPSESINAATWCFLSVMYMHHGAIWCLDTHQ